MKHYHIFSDSSCDTPSGLLDTYHIDVIPFYVSFDQQRYYKEMVELSPNKFFQTLTETNVFPHTSLPSVHDYINCFKPVILQGEAILCICLSQTLSGSYQAAVNAKEILLNQYPDATIEIIDSGQATAGQGLLLLQAANMRQDGYTIDDCIQRLEQLKKTARIMFTVDDLDYLSHGGRIGKVAAMAGNRLNLKPLIKLCEGELVPYTKVRGRMKSLHKMIGMVEEYFKETKERYADYEFCIVNATTMEDANIVRESLESLTSCPTIKPIFQIGTTIGSYVGPGTLGICFVQKYKL